MYVKLLSDRETEGEQAKEMQLNEYTPFLSSIKKNKNEAKRNVWRLVLIQWCTALELLEATYIPTFVHYDGTATI